MVIRVAAPNAQRAAVLVQEFVALFGGDRVSLGAGDEIRVEARRAPNRATVQALDAVERWLDESGTASVRIWVDDRPYNLERNHSGNPA